jgi:DNA polymerase-1
MNPDPITIDFETEAIVGNPLVHPPKPVGCAIWIPEQEPQYYAWGHPTGNNIYWGDFHEYLKKIRDSKRPVLFHNAGFDLSVWDHYYCNATWLWMNGGWKRVHDTMYLLFLADPYAPTLSLKPSASRYLGMDPEEQDELHNWILANIPEATKKTAGAYISRAPADIVGRYAIGDVVRTRKLFDHLYAKIVEEGMLEAYEREQRLFPIVLDGTQRGIRIDRDTLEYHETVYTKCLEASNSLLASKLGVSEFALESDESFADALEKAGAVESWTLTKTGKRSMSKENLHIVNPEVKILMDYRGALETCLQTFMRPWLEQSKEDNRLHPNWNQVKQMRGAFGNDKKGTQTGRLSSDSPNFQNVPTEFKYKNGKPLATPEGLHPLPLMRRYCLPEIDHLWLKRDFSSQEIRILAHFEDGTLQEAYRLNPSLDPHQMAVDLINAMIGVMYDRKVVKITGFSIIYGSGARGLSQQLGVEYVAAAEIREAYLKAMPGVESLMADVQRRGKSGLPIRTWGGRIYYAEPPKFIEGRLRDFAYKLLNYLIQGSAADQTKQSIVDWYQEKHWSTFFLATVHDEINISAQKDIWEQEMMKLKGAMNKDRFDVPFESEGFVGENWHDIKAVA